MRNLSRVEVYGVLAGMILIWVMRGAGLDIWTAAGSIIGAGIYLAIRNYFASRKKSVPVKFDMARQIEWSKSETRYWKRLLFLFGASPAYLIVLTLWIVLDYSSAMTWLDICGRFIDLIKPFMPLPDRSEAMLQISSSLDQTTILSHFAVVGQLGTILSMVVALGFYATYAPTAIKRSQSKERVPLRVLVGATGSITLIAFILSIVPAGMLISIYSGAVDLRYFDLIAIYGLLTSGFGLFASLTILVFLLAGHRGVRWG